MRGAADCIPTTREKHLRLFINSKDFYPGSRGAESSVLALRKGNRCITQTRFLAQPSWQSSPSQAEHTAPRNVDPDAYVNALHALLH
jgi:hypothetical protein